MPILDPNTIEFISNSPEQTKRLGIRLGALLDIGDVICLSGDLGSGKTTFVQGLAKGWGSLDQVTSPTFIIVNMYRKTDNQNLYHLDAYRLENEFEAEDLDFDLMLSNGVMAIEWPKRILGALPEEQLWVHFSWISDQKRRLVFDPKGIHFQKILLDFRQQAFGG